VPYSEAMKLITTQPSMVEQVHKAILSDIASGKLPAGARIIQEQIAQSLGVSRQPVQHALTLLRNHGILHDAPGRGLQVAPMDLAYVRQIYDVRAVIEGLAFRKAAENSAEQAKIKGPQFIRAGYKAAGNGSVPAMIAADMAFHQFIYAISENPLLAPSMETHWTHTQRVMGEVLIRDDKPRDFWEQHQELLDCVINGQAAQAERLAKRHILDAADFMIKRLREEAKIADASLPK